MKTTEIFKVNIAENQIKNKYTLMNANIEFEGVTYEIVELITTINGRQAFKCKNEFNEIVFLALLIA